MPTAPERHATSVSGLASRGAAGPDGTELGPLHGPWRPDEIDLRDDLGRYVLVPAEPSWDEIAERYGDTVYSMAYRLCGDRDEARDLAQDVFVRVYRNLDRYRPGTFEGWLYRITRNLFLDRVRRRSRFRLEPLPVGEWREPREPGPGPAECAEERLLDAPLESALAALPTTFRTAVVLCDVRGLSYEEIVEETGWPMGTVRSRIHRGRKLLRQRLTHRG